MAMVFVRWRRVLAPLLLGLLFLVSACSPPQPPSRFEQAQQATTRKDAPPAVAKGAEQGSSFNRFFPKSADGFTVVPAQEKQGFAEYKLNQAGKNVAMLSINDTLGTPAANKYQQSTLKIAGFPAVEQGQTGTGILVSDRYQVKVLSRDPSFTKGDRAAWLQRFNLTGLSNLK